MTAEALELEIERVWCAMANWPREKQRWLYLKPDNCLTFRLSLADSVPEGSRLIGNYTRTVHLAELREDVFFTFEQRGHRHG